MIERSLAEMLAKIDQSQLAAAKRGRIETLPDEDNELSRPSADIRNLIGMILAGHPEETQKEGLEGLLKRGVQVYEPENEREKPGTPANDPEK